MGMTAAIDVLLDARALLARPGGWIQGTRRAPNGQGDWAYCLEGAIDKAGGERDASWHALTRLEGVLERGIPEFNDDPNTEQADAVLALERAISAEWNGEPIPERVFSPPLSSALWAYIDDPSDAA